MQDTAGNRTLVECNVDAELVADFQIELVGLHGLTAGMEACEAAHGPDLPIMISGNSTLGRGLTPQGPALLPI